MLKHEQEQKRHSLLPSSLLKDPKEIKKQLLKSHSPKVLVLAPTRELANQVNKDLKDILGNSISVGVIFMMEQHVKAKLIIFKMVLISWLGSLVISKTTCRVVDWMF